MVFALKQPTPPPVYAPKVPTEPEIDPEELEKIFSGALPISVPHQMVKPYSLHDFFKRNTPPNQTQAAAETDTEEQTRSPQTLEDRERYLKTDIEKFRQYAKDKRFENLDDEDLTNYFAINIAENFRFDLGLLSDFVKSDKYLRLSSQDPAAEKYYMRTVAILKNYFEDAWGRTLQSAGGTSILNIPLTKAVPAPDAKPSGEQLPQTSATKPPAEQPRPAATEPAPMPSTLPQFGKPAFADPKQQAFHERTAALRNTQGGRSVAQLTADEKLTLLARLTAEHYGFDTQKIQQTLEEVEKGFRAQGKDIPWEERAYAEEAIRLIETEVTGVPSLKVVTSAGTVKKPQTQDAQGLDKTLTSQKLESKVPPSPAPIPKEPPRAEKPNFSEEEYLLWATCEKQLTARFRELFATMNEAQKMHVISAARDRIREEAKKRGITSTALDTTNLTMPIISNQEELLKIIDAAERSYAVSIKNFEAINEALANWIRSHPKEKLGEDEVTSIIFALPPLKASSAQLKMERVLLGQGTKEDPEPELILSNKENLMRLICGVSPLEYMAIQKSQIKDLYAKRKPIRLIKLCDGYNLRDAEAHNLTLRQFINKEIAFL